MLNMHNCRVTARGDVDELFRFDDGALTVNLDGYLIVPIELFTTRQITAAHKKWKSVAPAWKPGAVVIRVTPPHRTDTEHYKATEREPTRSNDAQSG